jgi:uncharacterized protein (DUF3820 family)
VSTRDKIKGQVLEALIARGFFPGEAEQMVQRLAQSDEQWEREQARFEDCSFRILPFGKHKGSTIAQVPRDYLYWLSGQDWFREKHYSLWEAVNSFLRDN